MLSLEISEFQIQISITEEIKRMVIIVSYKIIISMRQKGRMRVLKEKNDVSYLVGSQWTIPRLFYPAYTYNYLDSHSLLSRFQTLIAPS